MPQDSALDQAWAAFRRGPTGQPHGADEAAGRGASTAPAVLPQQLIAVVGPKGGVGRTFIACNLALSLQVRTGLKVALLDCDWQAGDVAVHLDMVGHDGIEMLLPYIDDLVKGGLDGRLVQHGSGLRVLLAPAKPEIAGLIKRDQLRQVLLAVRSVFDLAVVDTPAGLDNWVTDEVTNHATKVLVVATPGPCALRRTKQFLQRFQPGEQRLLLVVNQATGRLLPVSRVASFLGDLRTLSVPALAARVDESELYGRPVSTQPGEIGLALRQLVDFVCPGLSAQQAGPGWLARAWGWVSARYGRQVA